jgi:hypothetical protein
MVGLKNSKIDKHCTTLSFREEVHRRILKLQQIIQQHWQILSKVGVTYQNKCSVVMKLEFFGKECQHELTLLKLKNQPKDSKLPKIELLYTFVAMLLVSFFVYRNQTPYLYEFHFSIYTISICTVFLNACDLNSMSITLYIVSEKTAIISQNQKKKADKKENNIELPNMCCCTN